MALYMPLFRSCTSLRSLTQLHGHLLTTGRLCADPFPATKLVEAYSQMGDVKSSRLVFEAFEAPDSFMWGVLIKCCVWNRSFEEAISLYNSMVYHQVEVNRFIYPSVLRACSGCNSSDGEKIHGRIIKCGLDSDDVIETCLLSMYGEMGSVYSARKVFDKMPHRDVVSWSSIISTYVDNGDPNGGLDMLCSMVSEGIEPDSVTMLALVEACAELGSLDLARSVHGIFTRKIGCDADKLDNSLIVMYSKCGDLASAEKLFQSSASTRTVASWTAMISSYNKSGCFQNAVDVFLKMQDSKVEANSVTMMSILFSCAKLGRIKEGKSIHCFVIKSDIDPSNEFLGPPLMDLYADCGRINDSERVFDMIRVKDVVSWNMIISVYTRKGLLNQALLKLVRMMVEGVGPDSFSLAASLSACASLGFVQFGSQIHGHVHKTGFWNEFVQNALIDMYSKCGVVDSAYKLFISSDSKGVVTWNTMICGFTQNGYSAKAIRLFRQMCLDRLLVNEVTFLLVLQACADIGNVEMARWVHGMFITCGLEKRIFVETALVDMYSKCGDLETARLIFDNMKDRSVVTWSAMIGCYGTHGQVDSALSLFNRMVESGTEPNDVTFMNVLSSCSHAGFVENGRFYFELMKNRFGIEPNMEHFACLVDLLSRSGDLDEAYSVITSMPFPPHASIWCSFLNGCRIHRRTDMIRGIQQNLLDVDTDDTGFHTLLSNIYAEEGNWDESGKVRLSMESSGLKKVCGYSTV